ncbi:MAG: STAS domain-containing protein [Butyrivibrio sp.]|nr:STAS domain-containing protein [Butyrivibrio sp.]
MLNIKKEKKEGEIKISLEGRLDTATSAQLDIEVQSSLDNVEKLIFDLSGLEYISSAGLRVFLSAQKIMNKKGSIIVQNASEDVKDIFEMTGFSELFTIE